jgi:uncharacterized membrane protein YphA (DoxX/SURF4 family)
MNVALWIIGCVLAGAFLAAGGMKLTQPKEKLVTAGMGWAADFRAGTVKTIGLLEVLAAVGLILPAALDIVPLLVPLAAVGLMLIMVGAVITHARRHEPSAILVNLVLLVLLALAALVAWGRFGPDSFTS